MANESKAAKGHEIWEGGCNCGAVRYRVESALEPILNCHCQECLHFHGHVGAYTRTTEDAVAIIEQRGLKWWLSPADERRGFCQECGSCLFAQVPGETLFYITAGTLDDATGLETAMHMCVDEKPPYYEIDDDLPQLHYHV